MATQTQTPSQEKPAEDDSSTSGEEAQDPGTFTTDVSETDDEGTTVREAEVRKDDLTEQGSPESDEET